MFLALIALAALSPALWFGAKRGKRVCKRNRGADSFVYDPFVDSFRRCAPTASPQPAIVTPVEPPLPDGGDLADDGGDRDFDTAWLHDDEGPPDSSLPDYDFRSDARLVWVSTDGQQGVFVVPCPSPSYRHAQRFAFVALRKVRFADTWRWVSWCSNAHCEDADDLEKIFGNKSFASVSADEFLGGDGCLCNCGQGLLEARGGPGCVLQEFSCFTPSTDPVVEHRLGNKTYFVVGSASGTLGSWGVVHPYGQRLLCATCPSHKAHCRHVQAVKKKKFVDEVDQGLMDGDKYEERLEEWFDLQDGHRKRTCLSQQWIPEDYNEDAELCAILKGK